MKMGNTIEEDLAEASDEVLQYSTHASVARYIRIVEVTGSNPVCSTKQEKSELSAGRRRVWIFYSCRSDRCFVLILIQI